MKVKDPNTKEPINLLGGELNSQKSVNKKKKRKKKEKKSKLTIKYLMWIWTSVLFQ